LFLLNKLKVLKPQPLFAVMKCLHLQSIIQFWAYIFRSYQRFMQEAGVN